MDHIEYENSMIEAVNRNCKDAEQARMEAYLAEAQAREEEHKAMRICMKRKAAVTIVIWLEVFVCVLLSMLYLNLRGMATPVLQAATCGMVGLVTGLRVNALARAFRK